MPCCVSLWSENILFVSQQVAACVLLHDVNLAIGATALHVTIVRDFQ